MQGTSSDETCTWPRSTARHLPRRLAIWLCPEYCIWLLLLYEEHLRSRQISTSSTACKRHARGVEISLRKSGVVKAAQAAQALKGQSGIQRAYATKAGRLCVAKAAPSGSSKTGSKGQVGTKWDIRMLYDGECPLCMREVNMLKGRDEGVGKIDFVDISSPEYEPSNNADISYEEAMGEIHAILPDGKIVKNVEVFRRLYEAVGLGWIYAITKVGPIGKAADWIYGIWARYRMQITGRPDLATVFAEKKSCKIR